MDAWYTQMKGSPATSCSTTDWGARNLYDGRANSSLWRGASCISSTTRPGTCTSKSSLHYVGAYWEVYGAYLAGSTLNSYIFLSNEVNATSWGGSSMSQLSTGGGVTQGYDYSAKTGYGTASHYDVYCFWRP